MCNRLIYKAILKALPLGAVSLLVLLTLIYFPLSIASAEEPSVGRQEKFPTGLPGAQDPRAMWDKSIANPTDTGFILIRGWGDKKKEDLPPQLQPRQPKPETPAEASIPKNKEPERTHATREELIAIYGDPAAEPVIAPEQKAHKSFKGLHAALQIGDLDLAFNYARKHVRYLESFKKRMSTIQGLTAKAMEVEGLADGEGWTSAAEYDWANQFVEKAIKEKEDKTAPVWDQFLLALPKNHRLRAITPFRSANPEDIASDIRQELEHRDIFRRVFEAKAPKSLDGKVNLTLYVDVTTDKDSLTAARELAGLAKIARKRSQITFHMRSREYATTDDIQAFQLRTGQYGTPFDYMKSEEAAPKAVPLLEISIPSLKKTYKIQGVRRSYFYEELVAAIHGGDLS